MSTELSEERAVKVLADALREVFGENENSRRFIDISKIPLICHSITEIHANLAEIKKMMHEKDQHYVNNDQFTPVKNLVYGGTGIILTAVIIAGLAMIVPTH